MKKKKKKVSKARPVPAAGPEESKKITARIKNGKLILFIPLAPEGTVSGSGKSFVLATTHGFADTTLVVDGATVRVGINAIIPVE